MAKLTVTYEDSHDYTKMLFSNGNYLSLMYKFMKSEYFIFHYNIGPVNGTMKVRPQWTEHYDDIMGQAECSLPHLFFPTILRYLCDVYKDRVDHHNLVIEMWEQGKVKELKDKWWTSYYDISEKVVKELRGHAKIYTRDLKAMNLMANIV